MSIVKYSCMALQQLLLFKKRLSDKDQPPNIHSRFMYDLLPLSDPTSSAAFLIEVDLDNYFLILSMFTLHPLSSPPSPALLLQHND